MYATVNIIVYLSFDNHFIVLGNRLGVYIHVSSILTIYATHVHPFQFSTLLQSIPSQHLRGIQDEGMLFMRVEVHPVACTAPPTVVQRNRTKSNKVRSKPLDKNPGSLA